MYGISGSKNEKKSAKVTNFEASKSQFRPKGKILYLAGHLNYTNT